MDTDELMPFCRPWLDYWRDMIDPGGPQWKDEWSTAGLINDLARDREQLLIGLAPLPRAERLFEQICEIVDVVDDPDDPPGLYFVVKHPYPASADELVGWMTDQFGRIRELTGEPKSPPRIVLRRSKDPIGAMHNNYVDTFMSPWDWLSDWFFTEAMSGCTIEEHAAHFVLSEALYKMACDYHLAGYVEWVFVEDRIPGPNPYRYSFDVWRSGACYCHTDKHTVTIFAPIL
jgi:hypothetical protein